jgi:uncharacterized protein (UPF0332 family)
VNPLVRKADTAAKSARRLLADGDCDGACDRAYYAMFNAARALLEAEGKLKPGEAKTHQTILRLFSEAFVLSGRVSRDMGRGLGFVQTLRNEADYARTFVAAEAAHRAVELMEDMLAFATKHLSSTEEEKR